MEEYTEKKYIFVTSPACNRLELDDFVINEVAKHKWDSNPTICNPLVYKGYLYVSLHGYVWV